MLGFYEAAEETDPVHHALVRGEPYHPRIHTFDPEGKRLQ
jgi:hypothetical protein